MLLHNPGHSLILQHFRDNKECGVTEELPPIDKNLKYDFNYQVLFFLYIQRQ